MRCEGARRGRGEPEARAREARGERREASGWGHVVLCGCWLRWLGCVRSAKCLRGTENGTDRDGTPRRTPQLGAWLPGWAGCGGRREEGGCGREAPPNNSRSAHTETYTYTSLYVQGSPHTTLAHGAWRTSAHGRHGIWPIASALRTDRCAVMGMRGRVREDANASAQLTNPFS